MVLFVLDLLVLLLLLFQVLFGLRQLLFLPLQEPVLVIDGPVEVVVVLFQLA